MCKAETSGYHSVLRERKLNWSWQRILLRDNIFPFIVNYFMFTIVSVNVYYFYSNTWLGINTLPRIYG